MNFSVKRYSGNGFSLIGLQDNATNTIISILPAYGALLHGFEIPVQNSRLNIIDNYSGKDDLEQSLALSYKSSKLSPFVCRLRDGKYIMDDEPYEITHKFIDGNAIHGLLYNQPFNITDEYADDNKASVSMRHHYKRTDPGYPFDYVCEVRYTLLPHQTLQVDTTLLNLEDQAIPLADGWHPYFQLGGTIDDYELEFHSETQVEFDARLLPTGNLIPDPSFSTATRIGDKQLDNCFQLQPIHDGIPCCVLYNPGNHVMLSIFTDPGYPYLQIYTPSHRKSIAIENLSAAPDCFNNGMGLLMLGARRSQTFTVWYRVGVAENI